MYLNWLKYLFPNFVKYQKPKPKTEIWVKNDFFLLAIGIAIVRWNVRSQNFFLNQTIGFRVAKYPGAVFSDGIQQGDSEL